MAEANGNGGSMLRVWGPLALAGGAMFWTAASQWGNQSAVVTAALEGLGTRLGQHAARMSDLQTQSQGADRELAERIAQANASTQANATTVLRLTTQLEGYDEERRRLILDNSAEHVRMHAELDGIQRELQTLRERVIGLAGQSRDQEDRRP